MDKKIEEAIDEFTKYYNNFDTSIPWIKYKYYHTFRVVDYAKIIAESQNLNSHDYYLVFVCALLHDIARFKQYTEFGTYNDLLSFDHGDMACKILEKDDYILKYVDNNEDKEIVLKAVKHHNKYKVEGDFSERELFFIKITRDADKIDIMDMQGNSIEDNDFRLGADCVNAFLEKRTVNRKKNGNISNDFVKVFVTLDFIFDMNFKKSYELLKENGIVKRKLDVLRECLDDEMYIKIEKSVEDVMAKIDK